MHPTDQHTPPRTMRPPERVHRVAEAAHPAGPNGQGLVLIAGFIGYTTLFAVAITLSFVACSIAF